MNAKKQTPYIVCTGANGRCVIYGYSDTEPVPGQPARLARARMVIYWSRGGLLGLAANGPAEGSRLTAAIPFTITGPVQEVCALGDGAAAKVDAWPAC